MTSRSILSNKFDNIKNITSRIASASTIRPSSVSTNRLAKSRMNNNFYDKDNRPASSARSIKTNTSLNNTAFNFAVNPRADCIIEDKEVIENLKATLIRTVYTNREGRFILDSLPYDTYLIEIENSKNFIGCGMVFKPNFILDSGSQINTEKTLGKIKNGLGTFAKLIGLKRQTDAYVSIFISFIKDAENFDFITLKNCTIIFRKIEEIKVDSFIDEGKSSYLSKKFFIDYISKHILL